ncbi:NAD(P)H-binding protein [Pseudonocardia spinosispora]|uniref:NAD(P)H-binding protein n=1 Tax=Pseudonocardia spinosispora TaxID=103441 RepID=UPI0003FC6652|nr:NAD(P)H-binding protein [Pseudonocardia spinosispora]
MTILVLGGTGTTGSRVGAALRELGHPVRIATRRPVSGDDVRFDWTEPDTFGPAVAGARAVYLVASEPVLAEPFLDRARAAGVRRIVLLSSSAVAEGMFGLGELHRRIAATMPEWAVLRPAWFMQNFVGEHPLAAGIRADREVVTATGDGRVAFVDAGDIAAVAVRALTDDRPHNTDHLITGPRPLSYADAAAIITELTGRPVLHRPVSAAELITRLTGYGYSSELSSVLAALDGDVRAGSEDRTTDTVARLTGRPPRTFRDFVLDSINRKEL